MKWTGLLLLLLAFAACQNDLAEIEALAEAYSTQVETAKNVEILYSDSAQVRVRVTGPTMLYHLDKTAPHQEFPDGVVIDFFDETGEVTSQLTAQYGIRYENKAEVIVRDSVVWQSQEGEKLESEELIWDERRSRIYTKKFVVVTRPDEIIYGHGFEANQDFSYSRINAIEGRIKVDESANDNP
jgi:LPS export ABC transporter protein LptC